MLRFRATPVRRPGPAREAARGLASRAAALLLAAGAVACAAAAPSVREPGTGTVWGYLRLVPHEGVAPSHSRGSPYGDRRLRDVALVDYSRPGFAVVYLAEGPSPAGEARLEIRASGVRTRLEPPYAALGLGGALVVENLSDRAHVLSAPGLGLVRRLEPGARLELAPSAAGEQSLFLLDAPRSDATVFVAPGPFAVVSPDGRFELAGLAPGRHELLAWHPRFPPALGALDLRPDSVQRLDLEMGVDHLDDVQGEKPADLP
jgi:hypothetical protein